MNKDLRQLMREYRQRGWLITQTNHGHYRWESPQGVVVFTAGTPGAYRTILNIRLDLRRAESRAHSRENARGVD